MQAFETEGLIGAGAAPAVLTYLFHRIEGRLDGRPTLLIIDEGWLVLDDPAFAQQLREWLKTQRKKNASVVFATQSLSDIDGSNIAPATRRMTTDGYQRGTIKRVLGTVKAAVQWAWKNGELERPIPFLTVQDGPGRERLLEAAELAALWDGAEQPHLQMFIMLLLGTAGRPAAVLELTRERCDLDRRLIDLNPAGRAQTKKRRPVVSMPDFLRSWIENAPSGPLVRFRGKAVTKVNGSWRDARETAGLGPDVVPYTIHHTIATELRSRGVPEMELAGLLGHAMPNFRTTGRYAKYAPTHLSAGRAAIDDFVGEIGREATRSIHIQSNVRVGRRNRGSEALDFWSGRRNSNPRPQPWQG